MKNRNKNILFSALVAMVILLSACQTPGGESPGSEFMPDMGHSIAYEANYYNYYYNNTWGSEDEYYKLAQPRIPVKGTMPRGASTVDAVNAVYVPANAGAHVYDYADTEEERTRATAELINNPYPITTAGLAEGKELYDTFCGICHGEKGDGAGYLVRDDGGVYPVQPANFLLDEFQNASNGRYYHSIMHGKNLMGSYKDKISYEERWQVIHYIRSLQAKEKKAIYTQMENTLNSVDKPAGNIVEVMHIGDDHHHGNQSAMHGEGDHGDHHEAGEGHQHNNEEHHEDGQHDNTHDHSHDGEQHEEGHQDHDHEEHH